MRSMSRSEKEADDAAKASQNGFVSIERHFAPCPPETYICPPGKNCYLSRGNDCRIEDIIQEGTYYDEENKKYVKWKQVVHVPRGPLEDQRVGASSGNNNLTTSNNNLTNNDSLTNKTNEKNSEKTNVKKNGQNNEQNKKDDKFGGNWFFPTPYVPYNPYQSNPRMQPFNQFQMMQHKPQFQILKNPNQNPNQMTPNQINQINQNNLSQNKNNKMGGDTYWSGPGYPLTRFSTSNIVYSDYYTNPQKYDTWYGSRDIPIVTQDSPLYKQYLDQERNERYKNERFLFKERSRNNQNRRENMGFVESHTINNGPNQMPTTVYVQKNVQSQSEKDRENKIRREMANLKVPAPPSRLKSRSGENKNINSNNNNNIDNKHSERMILRRKEKKDGGATGDPYPNYKLPPGWRRLTQLNAREQEQLMDALRKYNQNNNELQRWDSTGWNSSSTPLTDDHRIMLMRYLRTLKTARKNQERVQASFEGQAISTVYAPFRANNKNERNNENGELAVFDFDQRAYPNQFLVGRDEAFLQFDQQYRSWLVKAIMDFEIGKMDDNESIGVCEAVFVAGLVQNENLMSKIPRYLEKNKFLWRDITITPLNYLLFPEVFDSRDSVVVQYEIPNNYYETSLEHIGAALLQNPRLNSQQLKTPAVVQEYLRYSLCWMYYHDHKVVNTGSNVEWTKFVPIIRELDSYIRTFYDPKRPSVPFFQTDVSF